MLKKKQIVITDAEIMAEMDKIVQLNIHTPWSDRELALLKTARSKGVSLKEISKRWKDWTGVNRSYDAIFGKSRRICI